MHNRSSFNVSHGWEGGAEADTEADSVSAHSGLLVSLLLRYPELGSVKYLPDTGCLVMGFVLRQVLSDDDFQALSSTMQQSLALFSDLSGNPVHVLKVDRIACAPFSTLQITRDVATLTPDELALIVGLLRARYAERLISESLDPMEAESADIQDDMIGHLLDDVRQVPPHRDLIGFREGRRVLLFRQGEPK